MRQAWRKGEEKAQFYSGMPYLGVCDTTPHRPSPGLAEGGRGILFYFYVQDLFQHVPLYLHSTVYGLNRILRFPAQSSTSNARSKEAPVSCKPIASLDCINIKSLY